MKWSVSKKKKIYHMYSAKIDGMITNTIFVKYTRLYEVQTGNNIRER